MSKKSNLATVAIASVLLGSGIVSASTHANPMSILNGNHNIKHKHAKRRPKTRLKRRYTRKIKRTRRTKHAANSSKKTPSRKRSLSSFGKMRHEYTGKIHNSVLTSINIDPNIYSKHILTDKPYLECKAIDGPLPQDYAKLFIKSKTLLSPDKTHLKIIVDKSIQRIFVYKDFEHLYTFKSSTGRAGHRTPSGIFKPYSTEEMHYSKEYHNSPMPWSVFFNGGVAIHGTTSIWRLGHTASHGCVRTHPRSARRIYKLVRKIGTKNTTIIVKN
jgi:lipoprotein-anchoring transpeptidase ErfK/SrfK